MLALTGALDSLGTAILVLGVVAVAAAVAVRLARPTQAAEPGARRTLSARMSSRIDGRETNARFSLEEVSDGVFAYVQPDGSWMINNTGFLVGRDGVSAIDACSTERRTRRTC